MGLITLGVILIIIITLWYQRPPYRLGPKKAGTWFQCWNAERTNTSKSVFLKGYDSTPEVEQI
jgi:hypothetical protein